MIHAPPVQNAMPSQIACFAALRHAASRLNGAGIPLHPFVAVTFDQPLDPHEQVGPHGLRAGVAAPHAAEQTGHQEQPDRGHDQQAGQIVDVLRPEFQIEEIEPLMEQVEQHRLVGLGHAAMPAQPWQQVIQAEAEDQHRPLEPPHRAVHRFRIDPHAVGVEMFAPLLLLQLQLPIGLADTRHGCSALSAPGLLAAAQRMDVQRNSLDGCGIEPLVPVRHHTHVRIGDLGHHVVARVGVQMDVRGQPRRPDVAVALAGVAVTDGAIFGEDFRCRRSRPCLPPACRTAS